MSNLRFIALKAINKIENDKAYSNIILDKIINKEDISKRDAAFVCNLVYGVLERKIQLDYIISIYSKLPMKKINTDVLNILRIGTYQLLFMDKVPDSAAVNESVDLAKRCKKKSAGGFINAILRNVSKNKGNIPMPNDEIEYLHINYSCPKDIITLWIDSYGLDVTKELLKSLVEKPDLIIRNNNLKNSENELIAILEKEGITAKVIDNMKNSLILTNSGSVANISAFKEGRFHIQDLASQILCKLMEPQEGNTIIDLCAAPGGKSFTLAEMMNNKGKVYSFDLYEHKIKLINDGANRLGINIIEAKVRDALSNDDGLESADKVLCDAPCSGLGIIRRKPEIKYKNLENIKELPALQYKILCNAGKLTKPNGILMYSTCTLNPNENGKVADKFLKSNRNFEAYSLNTADLVRTIDEPNNQFTFMPQTNHTDGFFIVAFKRIR